MAVDSRLLASGSGWRVEDVVCTCGPADRPFEEQHDLACIAVVTEGTFQYRSSNGSSVLAPGAVLLGNERQCFECGHDHGSGDRCLSFHFAPAFLEQVAAAVPRARKIEFAASNLAPQPALIAITATAEAARDDGDGAEFHELALDLAGTVFASLAHDTATMPSPSGRDARRVSAALRRIEAAAHEPLSLADLSDEAGMSPYHFLRSFHTVTGMTPYQFVLHTRLRRAAVRLRRTTEPISTIAFDEGFGDLSTFNRRFRRIIGQSPRAFRASETRGSGQLPAFVGFRWLSNQTIRT